MSVSNKHLIFQALKDLGLEKSDLREIPPIEARPILKSIKDRFLTNQNARWWWEFFRESLPVKSQLVEKGWFYLDRISPATDKKVWFVVEEDSPDIFRLYLGQIVVIQRVLGETPFFEYYVVDTDLQWLICENHHDKLYVAGAEVVRKFEELLEELG